MVACFGLVAKEYTRDENGSALIPRIVKLRFLGAGNQLLFKTPGGRATTTSELTVTEGEVSTRRCGPLDQLGGLVEQTLSRNESAWQCGCKTPQVFSLKGR